MILVICSLLSQGAIVKEVNCCKMLVMMSYFCELDMHDFQSPCVSKTSKSETTLPQYLHISDFEDDVFQDNQIPSSQEV